MLKKSHLLVIVIALVAINAFILYRFIALKKNYQIVLSSQNDLVEEHRNLSLQIPLLYQYIGTELDAEAEIEDLSHNRILLRDVVKNTAIVCRLSDAFCQSCNEYAFDVLRQCVKSIDNERVIFLFSSEQFRTFKYNAQTLGLSGNNNVYKIEERFFHVDEIGFPYFIAIDDGLKICSLYMPSKTTPDMDKYYLSLMINSVFKPLIANK